jgi:Na+-transporting methylmalonyl-CoA/oxaloacetate decarboxylase gamma subunit
MRALSGWVGQALAFAGVAVVLTVLALLAMRLLA